MRVAVTSRHCWRISFKKRINIFQELGMDIIEYSLLYKPDATKINLKFLGELVKEDKIKVVGVHGNLEQNELLEKAADTLNCKTISIHVNSEHLEKIESFASSNYNVLIEYPKEYIANKEKLTRILQNFDSVGVLVDLSELYFSGLLEGDNIRDHLRDFWANTKQIHAGDICGYLRSMAIGMGLGKIDFAVINDLNAQPILEIHPNYSVIDVLLSKYNLELILNKKSVLPPKEVVQKYL